uniref:OTU deubiquitinase with linear linkage specificity like n=1 Tax=Microcebus murinus TaxID=30608 RepID=A0A8C5VP24_MICMU
TAGKRAPALTKPRGAPRGRGPVHHWMLLTSQALGTIWRLGKGSVMLAVSFLGATLCCFKRLKFKRNLSAEAEVDLLSYCAREWKGETPRAKLMRKAYEELFWRHHIKCVRQVKRDDYDALRWVLFQIFSRGISFPSWMREKDIVKLPEKLLFSQGCNWIQQYSFGPEKHTGSNVFGKLRKCVELLKTQWTEFNGIKDYHKRGYVCNILFSDFIMLYQVTEVYDLFRALFARETSSDPLSFMVNRLNSVGDTCGLEQIDMFILRCSLEVKIKVFRLFKFNSRDFEVCYPEEPLRQWPEIPLLMENGHHYHIPVF